MLHVAHESPKNVLVTEHYSRNDWERTFGIYEGITEMGTIVGLAMGIILFASSLGFSTLSTYTLYLCSGLSVVALVMAVLLVADPLLIFERRLVGIERKMDFVNRGFEGSSKLMDGLRWNGKLKEDRFTGFVLAIVLFALATSLFFTPLPIFLRDGLAFVDKLGLFCVYFELCWGDDWLLPDWSQSPINEYKKTDAPLCASAQHPYFLACRSHRVCFPAYNHDGDFADFHWVRLRHVLHNDAFTFNGGHTSGKSRALRWNGRFRISIWRLLRAISRIQPELHVYVRHNCRGFLSCFLSFEIVQMKHFCGRFWS